MKIQFPDQYCVYDLETTGLDTDRCGVLEIAVKRVVGTEVLEKSWLIRQEFSIDEKIVEITGITDKMCAEQGVSLKEALTEFVEAMRGLPLVGHNIMRFDNRIMARLLRENGFPEDAYKLPMEKCIDTAAIYKADKMSEEPRWFEDHRDFAMRIMETRRAGLKFNLVHACKELGIKVDGLVAHRAAGDAEMADRVYRRFTQTTEKCGRCGEEIYIGHHFCKDV